MSTVLSALYGLATLRGTAAINDTCMFTSAAVLCVHTYALITYTATKFSKHSLLCNKRRGKMRFRFLGDVDCPEWLLAQIYNLSQMTSSKIKMLSQVGIKSITDQELDEELLAKISQDSKIEITELKALIAAVQMIFKSSARNAVSAADLNNELQQLGLPREHSTVITKFHTDNAAKISTILTGQSLRLSRLSSVEVVPNEDRSPFAKIIFKTTSGDENEKETTLNISKDKLNELLAELKTVRTLMEQVSQ